MEYRGSRSGKARRYQGLWKLMLLVSFLMVAPLRPAHAYLDPNAAGSLYQIMFPLLVAIGSAVAMTKRYIKYYCDRVVEACTAVFRRKTANGESKRLP
jgi:hypothetical protein